MRRTRSFPNRSAVAEEENITRAARRLGISQPPLTRQIQELERELRVTLFSRTGKPIHLTDAGRQMLAESKALLAAAERAVLRVQTLSAGLAGTLNIGYTPSVAARLVTAVVAHFRQTAPAVKIVLHDLPSGELLNGVRDGKLDAAFLATSGHRWPNGTTFEALAREELKVAVASSHPVSRQAALPVKDLLKRPVVTLDPKVFPEVKELFAQVLGTRARKVRPVEKFGCEMSFKTAVAAGVGVALTTANFGAGRNGDTKLLPLTPRPRPLEVGVLLPTRTNAPLVQQLRQFLRDQNGRDSDTGAERYASIRPLRAPRVK